MTVAHLFNFDMRREGGLQTWKKIVSALDKKNQYQLRAKKSDSWEKTFLFWCCSTDQCVLYFRSLIYELTLLYHYDHFYSSKPHNFARIKIRSCKEVIRVFFTELIIWAELLTAWFLLRLVRQINFNLLDCRPGKLDFIFENILCFEFSKDFFLREKWA